MRKICSFPLKECKNHSFCEYPETEDQCKVQFKDLKQYLKSLSPSKKINLKEREMTSTIPMLTPTELNFQYLKSIQEQMDDSNSVKPGIPIVTEEGLSDWCQQSMNRRFEVIPSIRPFLMQRPMYEYLKGVQELTRETPNNPSANKELMTLSEIQSIIEKKKVSIHKLQPRTMEGGTPFIYPRYKNKKKVHESLSVPIPKQKHKITKSSALISNNDVKNDSIKATEEAKELISNNYKLDSSYARQVLEITHKRMKFFQSLAFSSAFLEKIIEKDKSINLMIPPEFLTPLIELKDTQDFPSDLELYSKHTAKNHGKELQELYSLLKHGDWKTAVESFKLYVKSNPNSFDGILGLALSLERIHCYKISRKWFLEALKLEPENLDALLGLAVTSLKLNEVGDSIHFCKNALENVTSLSPEYFYYVLALCYRKIANMAECNKYYLLLVDNEDSRFGISTSINHGEWDEQTKSLPGWMQNRTEIPFFRRFKPKQLKKLSMYTIKKIEQFHVFVMVPGFSYVVIKGMLRLRDHSVDCTKPKDVWNIQTGQYINYVSHKPFYESLHYWMIAELTTFIIEIPFETFTLLSRESRTNKEIVYMHLFQSFPIFKDLSLETLEALVLESIKVKKCHKGQIVRKKITDKKIDKKSLFGVIITGICDLKREDGLDIAMISRGDYFGEEFIFSNATGLASIGNLVVRTENLEIVFISPQDLLRLPDYELNKIEQKMKNNPLIAKYIQKAQIGFSFHTRGYSQQ